MPSASSNRTVLVAISTALGAALLVIAFLLGRESARPAAPEPAASEPSVASDESEPAPADVEARRWPEWADLEPIGTLDEADVQGTDATPTRIERQPAQMASLSDRPTHEAPRPTHEPARTQDAVASYFLQMDVIQSKAGAGDPNAFAMDLIKAAMGNNTTGFDQLIADTQRMEAEAARITPPPSCEAYHQANLEALAASRQLLEQMKAAISGRDLEGLAVIAQKAQALQGHAELLRTMREQIDSDSSP